jgi:DNA-binding NtrC family response regulator
MIDSWGETPSNEKLSGFMGLIGHHRSMSQVFDVIRRVGPSSASVLITGESGTGKELVARALHHMSARSARNLVPVHCGAIPEDLLESELFGHTKGAFTGAIAARTGRFRLAHGGTIFLDEVGEMSPRFQVKLLRVLEDGTFEAVGSTVTQSVDVRVIAASHRDLRAAARAGTFREDLLYRLDVVTIHLPPLRERADDIPLIAGHFLGRLHEEKGLPLRRLSDEAVAALMNHAWPGNIRELRNVLERAVLLGDDRELLSPNDLPAPLGSRSAECFKPSPSAEMRDAAQPWDFGPEGTDFYGELEAFERRMITRALHLAGGSKREAARLLHVNRTTLLEKLKRRGWEVAASLVPENLLGKPCEAARAATPVWPTPHPRAPLASYEPAPPLRLTATVP